MNMKVLLKSVNVMLADFCVNIYICNKRKVIKQV